MGTGTGHEDTAVALRREWEAWKQQRDAELQRRHEEDVRQRDAYEAISWEARGEVSNRLREFIEALEPEATGASGEITVGIASVYLKALHELADLWGVRRPLRPVTPLPVPAEPEAVAVKTEAERLAAVEVLRRRGIEQLVAVRKKMLPAGGSEAS